MFSEGKQKKTKTRTPLKAVTPRSINSRKVLELNCVLITKTKPQKKRLGYRSVCLMMGQASRAKNSCVVLEQVTAALCRRGTASLSAGMVLDFEIAPCIESAFTIHHLNDESTQMFSISCAKENIKKCSQTNLITANYLLEMILRAGF